MRGQAESFSDDCASYIVEQIIGTKGLTEEEQVELMRQLEIQTNVMMDEIYDGEESLHEQSESYGGGIAGDALLNDAEVDQEAEYRIYDFQRTIDKMKQLFKEKKEQ